jgi:hypothetical protein
MARTPISLSRKVSPYTRKSTYYIRIWLPAEHRYATARSAAWHETEEYKAARSAWDTKVQERVKKLKK